MKPLPGTQRSLGLLEAAPESVGVPLGLLALPGQALAQTVRLLQIGQLSLSSTETPKHENQHEATSAATRGAGLLTLPAF